MIVTLDVFSGRPNPTWKLSEKDVKKFVERFEKRAVSEVSGDSEGTLGFRGLVLSSDTDDTLPNELPTEFRVGGPETGAFKEAKNPYLSADETEDAVEWLLSKGTHAVKEDVMAYVRDTVELQKRGLPDAGPEEMVEDQELKEFLLAAPCVIHNTPYNPGFWNVAGTRPYNNCYNYAMNYRSNTFAQPGRISGHPNSIMDCVHVGNAASWDGCKTTCSGSNKLVALVIWPGNDYHWYRRHSEGFWGHKPGSTAARNTDNLGRVINGVTLTPFSCARGPYTIFCGYRFSPTGMRVR